MSGDPTGHKTTRVAKAIDELLALAAVGKGPHPRDLTDPELLRRACALLETMGHNRQELPSKRTLQRYRSQRRDIRKRNGGSL
jgi:hypothetical protein